MKIAFKTELEECVYSKAGKAHVSICGRKMDQNIRSQK